MNKLKSELISIIGIGAFTYLSISGFFIMIKDILRDLFIILNTDNALNFWTTEIVIFVLFTITSFLAIKLLFRGIEKSEFKTRKIFITLFIGFFVIQILQFLYSYFGTDYVIENHNEKFRDFYGYLRENSMLGFYSSLIGICKYLMFGIIILIGKKTVANTVYN
ncbi:hypothetical protein [Olleya sp. Hel_I_94]|uniref:hypothetical protein n=1 Tax=Olleya sp. Hel_I_94 TaxID=1250001 RepID=UPI0011A91DE7|nr:hypothetical protein [Olleya sp. Hel_I_94]TVZ49866.1 hypothetical protein JM82_0305 [Olleya sp. Hel_I_94]